MPLPINAVSSVSLATQQTSLSPVALSQTQTPDVNAPVTISQVPPASDSNSPVAQAVKALGLIGKLAGDLQDVASALAPSMQKIIEDRPDLATAQFDFQSDNGSIKVVSNSLNDHDKAWLQQTLNANSGLVAAVKTFHDDATKSYALWAGADGKSLSPSDIDKVSQLADQHFNFIGMFQNASRAMLQNMDRDGSYTSSNGAPIDFHQSVNSPLSFLVFQKSNLSILNGSDTETAGDGRKYYGAVKGNFFSSPGVIPGFLPDTSSSSLGLDEMA